MSAFSFLQNKEIGCCVKEEKLRRAFPEYDIVQKALYDLSLQFANTISFYKEILYHLASLVPKLTQSTSFCSSLTAEAVINALSSIQQLRLNLQSSLSGQKTRLLCDLVSLLQNGEHARSLNLNQWLEAFEARFQRTSDQRAKQLEISWEAYLIAISASDTVEILSTEYPQKPVELPQSASHLIRCDHFEQVTYEPSSETRHPTSQSSYRAVRNCVEVWRELIAEDAVLKDLQNPNMKEAHELVRLQDQDADQQPVAGYPKKAIQLVNTIQTSYESEPRPEAAFALISEMNCSSISLAQRPQNPYLWRSGSLFHPDKNSEPVIPSAESGLFPSPPQICNFQGYQVVFVKDEVPKFFKSGQQIELAQFPLPKFWARYNNGANLHFTRRVRVLGNQLYFLGHNMVAPAENAWNLQNGSNMLICVRLDALNGSDGLSMKIVAHGVEDFSVDNQIEDSDQVTLTISGEVKYGFAVGAKKKTQLVCGRSKSVDDSAEKPISGKTDIGQTYSVVQHIGQGNAEKATLMFGLRDHSNNCNLFLLCVLGQACKQVDKLIVMAQSAAVPLDILPLRDGLQANLRHQRHFLATFDAPELWLLTWDKRANKLLPTQFVKTPDRTLSMIGLRSINYHTDRLILGDGCSLSHYLLTF